MTIIRKIRERWNSITDIRSDELPKLFSKEWFVLLLAIGGILAFITLLVFICHIFDLDVDSVFSMLILAGFTFGVGFLYGYDKGNRHRRENKN